MKVFKTSTNRRYSIHEGLFVKIVNRQNETFYQLAINSYIIGDSKKCVFNSDKDVDLFIDNLECELDGEFKGFYWGEYCFNHDWADYSLMFRQPIHETAAKNIQNLYSKSIEDLVKTFTKAEKAYLQD